MRAPVQPTRLRNGDCVAIVGGGPAGSFFAIHLLREAKQLDRNIDVVIVEKRGPTDRIPTTFNARDATFARALFHRRLNEILDERGLAVPDEIIQGRIDYVWIHGQWKNFRLRVPKDAQMYSVFRGSLPGRRWAGRRGSMGFCSGRRLRKVRVSSTAKSRRLPMVHRGCPT